MLAYIRIEYVGRQCTWSGLRHTKWISQQTGAMYCYGKMVVMPPQYIQHIRIIQILPGMNYQYRQNEILLTYYATCRAMRENSIRMWLRLCYFIFIRYQKTCCALEKIIANSQYKANTCSNMRIKSFQHSTNFYGDKLSGQMKDEHINRLYWVVTNFRTQS